MIEDSGKLKDQILLALDSSPSHGYDLLKTLEKDGQSIMITTLYRWLHQMESQGLVVSEVQSSPHGPPRRVYRLGSEGGTRLREMTRSAVEVITYFYEKYSYFRLGSSCKLVSQDSDLFSGKVLFVPSSKLNEFDLEILEALTGRCNGSKIHILGSNKPVSEQKIVCRKVRGDITDIRSRRGRYSLVWLNEVPETSVLPLAIADVHRVLKDKGSLFMVSPLTFFNEPQELSLGAFLRYTSEELFPEGRVRDGNLISRVLDDFFPITRICEVFQEFVVFHATKMDE